MNDSCGLMVKLVMKTGVWLPVRARVCFMLLLLVHRAVNCRGPVYLRDLICFYTLTRSLRSQGTKQLKIPKTNCIAGDSSFPAASPALWNWLPFQSENCSEVKRQFVSASKRILLFILRFFSLVVFLAFSMCICLFIMFLLCLYVLLQCISLSNHFRGNVHVKRALNSV